MRVGLHEVEIELAKGSFGQELSAPGEGFQVEAFVFDEAVDGFDPSADGL